MRGRERSPAPLHFSCEILIRGIMGHPSNVERMVNRARPAWEARCCAGKEAAALQGRGCDTRKVIQATRIKQWAGL